MGGRGGKKVRGGGAVIRPWGLRVFEVNSEGTPCRLGGLALRIFGVSQSSEQKRTLSRADAESADQVGCDRGW
jgi:hypothetical protein